MYLILIVISFGITSANYDNGMCVTDGQCTETHPDNKYTAGL